MRMVPPSPYDTGSQAEKRVFERLRAAFDDRYAAYHSLKPTRHPHKRFPEIDFVVCGPDGLYVLEVKGGGVARHGGAWHYRGPLRPGRSESQEGPFRQAEAALHGLVERPAGRSPRRYSSTASPPATGWCSPIASGASESAEWDPAMLAGIRAAVATSKAGCAVCFAYWQVRGMGEASGPGEGALRTLQEYLRPEVDAPAGEDRGATALRSGGGRAAARGALHRRPDAHGGRGRGEPAGALRRRRGNREDVPCREAGPALGRSRTGGRPGMPVSLAPALPRVDAFDARTDRIADRRVRLDCRRAGLERFDALIVDEGQDLFEMRCLETVDSVLAGGLECRSMVLVPRSEQPVADASFRTGRAKEYLESLDPRADAVANQLPQHPASSSKWIQDTLGADLGVKCGAGAGPDIRFGRRSPPAGGSPRSEIAREIVELVDAGGPRPRFGDDPVTVRALRSLPLPQMPPGRRAPGPAASTSIPCEGIPGDKVGFARIEEFKGLENEAIVIVDLPDPEGADGHQAAHYVAMSRARSVLSLIYRNPL